MDNGFHIKNMKKIIQDSEFLVGISLVAIAFVLLAFLVFFANNTPGKVLSIFFAVIAGALFVLLLILLVIKINQRRKKNARIKTDFQSLARKKKRSQRKKRKSAQKKYEKAQNSKPVETTGRQVADIQEISLNRSMGSDMVPTSTWSLELLRILDWRRFQLVCSKFFTYSGYAALLSPAGKDTGFDIRIFKKGYSKKEPFALVRCVSWNRYQVGIRSLRELYGVMMSEKVPYSIFVTSGSFTEDAWKFSKDKNMLLIDGKTFMMLIRRLSPAKKANLLTVATRGDFSSPTCPACGKKMNPKNSSHGRKWVCSNYPECREYFFIPRNRVSPERRLR